MFYLWVKLLTDTWLAVYWKQRYYLKYDSTILPHHNDARLRPIKLTENYIDDIFWARKFHAIRANGVDKISNSNDIE